MGIKADIKSVDIIWTIIKELIVYYNWASDSIEIYIKGINGGDEYSSISLTLSLNEAKRLYKHLSDILNKISNDK